MGGQRAAWIRSHWSCPSRDHTRKAPRVDDRPTTTYCTTARPQARGPRRRSFAASVAPELRVVEVPTRREWPRYQRKAATARLTHLNGGVDLTGTSLHANGHLSSWSCSAAPQPLPPSPRFHHAIFGRQTSIRFHRRRLIGIFTARLRRARCSHSTASL